jgi:uncharacterized protein (TIGR03083 family)
MNTETYLQHIEADGEALIAAVAAAPSARIATCPGWTNRDLAKHVGNVYSFVIAQLRAADPAERAPSERLPAPAEGDITPWLRERHTAILATLRSTAPASPAWNWTANKTAAFFYRRMAHETAVHRLDAQQAAGTPAPIDPVLATDGVSEMMEVFMQHRPDGRLPTYPRGSLHLHRTDGDGEWMLKAQDGTLSVSHEHAKGDAAARGSAQDLLIYLWGRGRDGLECHGEDALLDAWGSLAP